MHNVLAFFIPKTGLASITDASPNPSPKELILRAITVHTTASCQKCRITKRKLDDAKIPYATIDASTKENEPLAAAIRARAEELGERSEMPYVTVYDEHNVLIADWFSFRPDLINEHILEAN